MLIKTVAGGAGRAGSPRRCRDVRQLRTAVAPFLFLLHFSRCGAGHAASVCWMLPNSFHARGTEGRGQAVRGHYPTPFRVPLPPLGYFVVHIFCSRDARVYRLVIFASVRSFRPKRFEDVFVKLFCICFCFLLLTLNERTVVNPCRHGRRHPNFLLYQRSVLFTVYRFALCARYWIPHTL